MSMHVKSLAHDMCSVSDSCYNISLLFQSSSISSVKLSVLLRIGLEHFLLSLHLGLCVCTCGCCLKTCGLWDFPGCTVVTTPCSQRGGPGFDPWSGS